MRHRFHSICPYFAMFPETFVEKHLAASPHAGMVFDPFCGRGTTVFQALLRDREAAGCDLSPVAACIAGAKCEAPGLSELRSRLDELKREFREPDDDGWQGELEAFFDHCFHRDTLLQVRYLRSSLNWRHGREDRFIAALGLGALHGESHRSPNCFSNRMPRTISTKPDYSLRWWRRKGCTAPRRDVFDILDRMIAYRFRTLPPGKAGTVIQADARQAGQVFPALAGRVTDVVTSPPYLDTTNYREDQWLRSWFLGGAPLVPHDRQDDRHYSNAMYWSFLEESLRGLSPLLAERARIVIRIGGRRLGKGELREGLLRSLAAGLGREVRLVDGGVTSGSAARKRTCSGAPGHRNRWSMTSVSSRESRGWSGSTRPCPPGPAARRPGRPGAGKLPRTIDRPPRRRAGVRSARGRAGDGAARIMRSPGSGRSE